MKSKILSTSVVASIALLNTPLLAQEIELDPIVVSSDFRDQKLSRTSSSVAVISQEEISDKSSQPFESVIGQTPNINFATGASRAHYIQIRGIGERSQFETPVNPSVGLSVDGVDFSQSALGVTMFDMNQIEVLRGPQGTTFGANGMAGVVSMQSNPPTADTEGRIEMTVGDYNTKAVGVAIGGSLIEEKLLGRVSIYKNSSDGFMENSFLGRKDTNNIDELTTKAQLRWLVSDDHTIDLMAIYLDVDNGYDAFTLDNTRVSQSDTPGKDSQKTKALSLKSTYQINPSAHLITKMSYSKSDLIYSYDEDWGYVGRFDPALGPYNYYDEYVRDREQLDIDVRLVSDEEGRIWGESTDWTIGLYAKKHKENLTRNHTKEGVLGVFTNSYDSKNIALYGQTDSAITDKLTLTAGLRVEKWEAEYSDSNLVAIDTDETLVGGKIGLKYQQDANHLYYISLSKGYKPGGVNADNTLAPAEKEYKTETLWSIDAGLNSSHLDDKLVSRINLFYGMREDQQVKVYNEVAKNFSNYLKNAAKGSYYGVEAELHYYPTDAIELYASLGILKSEFDDYTPALDGRAPAHSPEYQYNLGLNYKINDEWSFKTNLEGKGSYYFSNTHDQKSEPYKILNTSLVYTHGDWTASIWAKNITDEQYSNRGFFFPNNPANGYAPELYTQKGAPRTVGFTVSYDF